MSSASVPLNVSADGDIYGPESPVVTELKRVVKNMDILFLSVDADGTLQVFMRNGAWEYLSDILNPRTFALSDVTNLHLPDGTQ